MTRSALVTLLILIMLLPSSVARSQVASDANRLGQVSFATSCAPAAQAHFTRGVALLHSFWLDAAIKEFTETAQADPTCGIAGWGVAMAWMGNPLAGPPSARGLKDGWAAVEKARTMGAKTQRERD